MIRLVSVTKAYPIDGREVRFLAPPVLRGVDWEIGAGETVVLRGESGSGKTTLLNLIGGLDRPTEGEVWVEGRRVDDLEDDALARWRGERIGLIFQEYHLELKLTASENVALPLLLADVPRGAARDQAREALRSVGLEDCADRRVGLLSGGQCQRVVVARALVRRPRILLADEPTANLDEDTARLVLDLLAQYQAREKATWVLVSHDRIAVDHSGWRHARCANGTVTYEAT